jgi:class 3 adenylate cyclase
VLATVLFTDIVDSTKRAAELGDREWRALLDHHDDAVRSGLHTDEIELKRDDVTGIAVHIAARVAAEAKAGETVVSSTVRDLVAGSGLSFQDRGIHELKGLPEALHLYSVLQVR